MKKVLCAICQSDKSSKLFDIKEPDIKAYSIVRCDNCNLAFINPRFEEEEIDNFYDENYFTFHDVKQMRQIMYAVNSIKQLKGFKSSGNLLDIGSAKGFFLMVAKKQGYNVMGLEISKFAARFTEDVFGIKTLSGTVEDAQLPENYFDIITMFDVIEHFQDPQKSLMKIRTALKEDGILVVDTPNVKSLYSRFRRGRWGGYGKYHLLNFSIDTLTKLLSNSGYSVISSTSYKIDLLSIDSLWRLGIVDYRTYTRLEQIFIMSKISSKIDAPVNKMYKNKKYRELKDLIDKQVSEALSKKSVISEVIKIINSPINGLLKNKFAGDAIRVYAVKNNNQSKDFK
jgi:SAM-dependent methyltransferase